MGLLLNDFVLLAADSQRLFGIKFYDNDFLELMMRLGLTLLVSYTIILKIFKSTMKDNDYLFTYLIFSPLIFFICHMFATTTMSIGFAFGLFAVFSILRYRTTPIPVKEMTYMFIIIAVSVINAISTKKVSYAELIFTNLVVLIITFLLEKYLFTTVIENQLVHYEIIENIKPENEEILRKDLQERTGLEIESFEILEADFLKDAAKIRIYFKRNNSN